MDRVLHVKWYPDRDEWVVLEGDEKPQKARKDRRFARKREAEAAARYMLRSENGGDIVIHSASETIRERVSVPAATAAA